MLASQIWPWMFGMPQIIFVMAAAVSVAGVLGYFWYKTQRVRSISALKHAMIEQGRSADEIERILAAGEDDDAN